MRSIVLAITALLLRCTALVEAQTTPLLEVGGAVFTQPCWDALNASDVNGDGFLNGDEYVLFAEANGPPGIVSGVTDFAGLPAAYKAAFLVVACLCDDPLFGGFEEDGCCRPPNTPLIRVTTPPGDDQPDEDFRYLYQLCGLADAAARAVLDSPAPSSLPTQAPSPTPESTDAPTTSPNVSPTTSPTSSPTEQPVGQDEPTKEPTTPEPTTSPSSSPTGDGGGGTVQLTATVPYTIAVNDDSDQFDTEAFQTVYYSDLIVAMDRLAPEVATKAFPGDAERRRRRLLVTVQLPSGIGSTQVICKFQYCFVVK